MEGGDFFITVLDINILKVWSPYGRLLCITTHKNRILQSIRNVKGQIISLFTQQITRTNCGQEDPLTLISHPTFSRHFISRMDPFIHFYLLMDDRFLVT
ncbi:hypothetical protein JTE90_004095 [Oedothorax gibbosus]|uniref:Uncharacterized protein n=1 Tax=Oedothorax gibbosus TaxID=931172 RepID=A0AAV6UDP3_9ARAC|nr:hypothetical protein JTE90_004095 [Oedothorax gibbosus]